MIDIEAIEARADAATPGPWTLYGGNHIWAEPHEHVAMMTEYAAEATETMRINATFIVAARTDVPDLIAEVRRLHAALAAREALLTELVEYDGNFRDHERRSQCNYCGNTKWVTSEGIPGWTWLHEPDCVVMRVRAALNDKTPDATNR